MAFEFQTPLDIANRALQHLGAQRLDPIIGFNENSKRATEIQFAYDKLRVAELRRNVWTFATKRAVIRPVNAAALSAAPFSITPAVSGTPVGPTLRIFPPVWSAYTTYPLGALVIDAYSVIWQSLQSANLNNAPNQSPAWEEYFGPIVADVYIAKQGYYAGELVYTFAGSGVPKVFQSTMNNNQAAPMVPSPWSATQVYNSDDVVVVYQAYDPATLYGQGAAVLYTDGIVYASLVGGNLSNVPPLRPDIWFPLPTSTSDGQTVSTIAEYSPATSYTAGSIVDFNGTLYIADQANQGVFPPDVVNWTALTGGTLYQSTIDLNVGNLPSLISSFWSTTITSTTGATTWRSVQCLASPLALVYPLGSGPTWQSATRNAFRLPANYLRRAPSDPKAGSFSWLGAPSNSLADDYMVESDYLVSQETGPIILRFVANTTCVARMDPMFCEGLAARIAYEVCQPITQSNDKQQALAQAYKEFMTEARRTNSIEVGADEQPLDDWIAARL